jgi:hypothetical protein
VAQEPNEFGKIVSHHAQRLSDAPGAKRLAHLAQTSKRIPEPRLDLAAPMLQLDDVELIGSDISIHLIEIGFCDVRYAGAVEFLGALRKRLQNYVDDPRAAKDARAELKDRVAWWKMALSRAGELCRWPAVVLTEVSGGP